MKSAVQDSRDVIGLIQAHSPQLRALGIARIGLFGSFARDEATSESDVDLLVEFVPDGKTYDRFLAVSELLESILQRPVELVTREALSPYLGPRILASVRYVSLAA